MRKNFFRSRLGACLLGAVCSMSVVPFAPAVGQVPAGNPVNNMFNENFSIMYKGDKAVSPSGRHVLVIQDDGDVVVYTIGGVALWKLSQIFSGWREADFVSMNEGNLTIYKRTGGKEIWRAVPNATDKTAVLTLEDDGILRVRSKQNPGVVVWASQSAPAARSSVAAAAPAAAVASPPAGGVTVPPGATTPNSGYATGFPIRPGQTIAQGKKYVSPDGQSYLIFGTDRNLVVRAVQGDGYRWGLDQQRINFRDAQQIMILPDGNLVAGDTTGKPVWAPVGNDAAANSFLTLEGGVLKMVSPAGKVTWSSDEKPAGPARLTTQLPLPPYENGKCTPELSYPKCRVVDNPRIFIFGTSRVSDSAMNLVQKTYTDLTSRLTPAYPKAKLNFVRVLITNGESKAELMKLPGVGGGGRTPEQIDQLRGGGGPDITWITEQMICKTGVKTRGAADKDVRTLDQVVHEFGHTMDFRFDRRKKNERTYANHAMGPVEGPPWAMQQWFGVGHGDSLIQIPQVKADMEGMFTSRTTYTCNGYRP